LRGQDSNLRPIDYTLIPMFPKGVDYIITQHFVLLLDKTKCWVEGASPNQFFVDWLLPGGIVSEPFLRFLSGLGC
ncbi:MAG: hypothetical protein WD605_01355, partial [Candidatus Paceibacterota bacterium]